MANHCRNFKSFPKRGELESCVFLFLCFSVSKRCHLEVDVPLVSKRAKNGTYSFFSHGKTQAESLSEAAGLHIDSVAKLELNCTSRESFPPRAVLQPHPFADIPKCPPQLQGNFQMPLAKYCKAFGISANEQKVFGEAPWHFLFLFFYFFCFFHSAQDILQSL